MNDPMKRSAPSVAGGETGAATLLLVLGLVLLATLASAWSSRAVLVNLLTSQTRGQSHQAQSAAQAALATAEADVLRAFDSPQAQSPFSDKALSIACPGDRQGPRWQCVQLPMAAGREMNGWQLDAIALRDLIESPNCAPAPGPTQGKDRLWCARACSPRSSPLRLRRPPQRPWCSTGASARQ